MERYLEMYKNRFGEDFPLAITHGYEEPTIKAIQEALDKGKPFCPEGMDDPMVNF